MLSGQEEKEINIDKNKNIIEENNNLEENEKYDIILEKERFKINLYTNKIIILQKEEEECELLYIELFFALRDFTKFLDSLNIEYNIKIINTPKLIINLEFNNFLEESIQKKLKNFYENLN